MKHLSILATAVVAAGLMASANLAYAQGGGGFDHRGQAIQIEQAVAAAVARASMVATKKASEATQTK